MNHQHQTIETCAQCGNAVELRSGAGRVAAFRGHDVPVPADLAIRTCVSCGAEWMNRAELREYSAAMGRQLRRIEREVPALQAPEALPVSVPRNELKNWSGVLATLQASFDRSSVSVTVERFIAGVTNHASPAPAGVRRVA